MLILSKMELIDIFEFCVLFVSFNVDFSFVFKFFIKSKKLVRFLDIYKMLWYHNNIKVIERRFAT